MLRLKIVGHLMTEVLKLCVLKCVLFIPYFRLLFHICLYRSDLDEHITTPANQRGQEIERVTEDGTKKGRQRQISSMREDPWAIQTKSFNNQCPMFLLQVT